MSAPNRDLLESTHTFPGPFTLKAIGPHSQAFVDDVRDAAGGVHTGDGEVELSARASSKGNHVSVTVTIVAADPDAVFALYAAVKQVNGLRMLL